MCEISKVFIFEVKPTVNIRTQADSTRARSIVPKTSIITIETMMLNNVYFVLKPKPIGKILVKYTPEGPVNHRRRTVFGFLFLD